MILGFDQRTKRTNCCQNPPQRERGKKKKTNQDKITSDIICYHSLNPQQKKHDADLTFNKVSVVCWTHVADLIGHSYYFKLMQTQTSPHS